MNIATLCGGKPENNLDKPVLGRPWIPKDAKNDQTWLVDKAIWDYSPPFCSYWFVTLTGRQAR